MSNALALFEPQSTKELMDFCGWLAKSKMMPRALQGQPQDIAIVLMTGRELGISAMTAISSIDVIEGKGVVSAKLAVALCTSHPDICEYFRLIDSSVKSCTYETKRKGAEPVRLSYTLEQAAAAKLTHKDNWVRHPASMLRARCSKALADAVYPDLVKAVLTRDEAEEIAERMAERDVTPKRKTKTEALEAWAASNNVPEPPLPPEANPETGELPLEPGAQG